MGDGLRVLYIEDDPALRSLLAHAIARDQRIERIVAVGSPRAAFDAAREGRVDVVLLDVALGRDQPSGMEVGVALRGIIPRVPIVVFSHHRVPNVESILRPEHRGGWSFMHKQGSPDIDRIVHMLEDAASGIERLEVTPDTQPVDDVLQQLTWRQREIMALACAGYDAIGIAERLHLAHITIRKELSHAYRVLVPNPAPGTDLRTTAVLAYLRLDAARELVEA